MSRFRVNDPAAFIVGIISVILNIIGITLGLIMLREETPRSPTTEDPFQVSASIFLIFALFVCIFVLIYFLWKLRSIRKGIDEILNSLFSWVSSPGSSFKFRKGGMDVTIKCPSFYITMHLITNEQYKFLLDSNSEYEAPPNWKGRTYPPEKARHPVVDVSRKDAEVYCRWLSEMTGKSYRLPDEYEWEKAARGESGRDYPWEKQEFDPQKCNSAESRIDDKTPVDRYENGRSPYGCYDMVGNVSEWTSSTESDLAVIRGSSYKIGREQSTCHYRILLNPDDISDFIGFRIVREAD